MQCNTGGTRGVHCGVISSATAQSTHTIYNENTLHVAVPVGSPVSLPVMTTCTPVVGAGPEIHSVTQCSKLEAAVVCNISSLFQCACLPYTILYTHQSSCSAMYTRNHAHTILDVSISYIDAIDS